MIDENRFRKGVSDILDDFRILCFDRAKHNITITKPDYDYMLGRLQVVIKMFWGGEE